MIPEKDPAVVAPTDRLEAVAGRLESLAEDLRNRLASLGSVEPQCSGQDARLPGGLR